MSRTRAYGLMALVCLMVFFGTLIDGSIAHGDERDPHLCMEDELLAPVHYATPGAVDDAGGVTRMCIHIDTYLDEAYALGHNHGYDVGYGDAAREAKEYYGSLACQVVVVLHRTYTQWPN